MPKSIHGLFEIKAAGASKPSVYDTARGFISDGVVLIFVAHFGMQVYRRASSSY